MAGRKARRKQSRRRQLNNAPSAPHTPEEAPDVFASATDRVSLLLAEDNDDSEVSDDQEEAVLDLQDDSSEEELEDSEDEGSGGDLVCGTSSMQHQYQDG